MTCKIYFISHNILFLLIVRTKLHIPEINKIINQLYFNKEKKLTAVLPLHSVCDFLICWPIPGQL